MFRNITFVYCMNNFWLSHKWVVLILNSLTVDPYDQGVIPQSDLNSILVAAIIILTFSYDWQPYLTVIIG